MIKYLLLFFLIPTFLSAQDDLMDLLDDGDETKKSEAVFATFKTTRIINSQSIETVKAKSLDIRITHRFGDAATKGSFHELYGIDNVADVRLSAEYGITDDLTVGFGRSKGARIQELWDLFGKYKILSQTKDNKMPVSVGAYQNIVISSMVASSDSTSETSFQNTSHRLSFITQLIIARKFNDFLSLQIMPTYSHRNYVAFDDVNGIFAIGIGGRVMFTKRFGIIADYFYLLPNGREVTVAVGSKIKYLDPLSVGLVIETGGHVFHINFSNSRGVLENEFIPHTTSDWLAGEFRLGFNISRVFTLFYK